MILRGRISFDELRVLVDDGSVDTVLAVIVDMQGRLMGKRFHGKYFCERGWEGSFCCNYLLATDLEMYTVPGYASRDEGGGLGDYEMRPDLGTLRLISWLEGTVMVMCDLFDAGSGEEVMYSPRGILRRVVKLLADEGYEAMVGTELEFCLYEGSYGENFRRGYEGMEPVSGYNEDYHIFQTTKDEGLLRRIRNELYASGVDIEGTRGESERGQYELNMSYGGLMESADVHTLSKHGVKEMTYREGLSCTFMSKSGTEREGSSSHIHQSLRGLGGEKLFYDSGGRYGMSRLMESYVAGLLKYGCETIYFLAPYVNSYKRLRSNSFWENGISWSVGGRNSSYRLCGHGGEGVRIECRLGGSDMNPYLGLSSQLLSGLSGVREGLELGCSLEERLECGTRGVRIPGTLYEAREALEGSEMLRSYLGDGVVDHYVRSASWELEDFERVVTDYELRRGFERA
jgi:glutamine synthetase